MCDLLRKHSTTTHQEKKKTMCRIDKRPPCFPKLKSSDKRYTKAELMKIWKEGHCDAVWKEKVRLVKDYCHAFVSLMKEDVVAFAVTPKFKLLFSKILEKYRQSHAKWVYDRVLQYTVKTIDFSSSSLQKPSVKIDMLYTDKELTTINIHLYPLCSSGGGNMTLPRSFTTHRKSLFNRNMTVTIETHLEKWLHDQTKYIFQTLTYEQRLILLTYTYGGDQMLNQYLLGIINPLAIIPEMDAKTKNSLYSRYRDLYIMPLVIFLYRDMQVSASCESFIQRVLHVTTNLYMYGKRIVSSLKTLYKKKNDSISSVYTLFFRFLVRYREIIPLVVFQRWLKQCARELKSIILSAPRPQFSFYVYRGIKTNEYVVIGHEKKHVFVQKSFMSTSLNLCEALSFKAKDDSCCIHQIFVPKNSSCLFMALTYFQETEVLFPSGSSLYPITQEYTAKNVDIRVQDFALV